MSSPPWWTVLSNPFPPLSSPVLFFFFLCLSPSLPHFQLYFLPSSDDRPTGIYADQQSYGGCGGEVWDSASHSPWILDVHPTISCPRSLVPKLSQRTCGWLEHNSSLLPHGQETRLWISLTGTMLCGITLDAPTCLNQDFAAMVVWVNVSLSHFCPHCSVHKRCLGTAEQADLFFSVPLFYSFHYHFSASIWSQE